MKLLCNLGFHKWVQITPRFKTNKTYWSMNFSVVSGTSKFYEFRAECKRCGKIQTFLEEVMTYAQYAGHTNRVRIPRFTVKEGIDFDIKQGLKNNE